MNSLIPINDESSMAFCELFGRLGTLDITPILIYLIDSVDSSALPHLAEQFHVSGNEGWLLALNDQEKRNLIRNSIELHKYKGTKYAVLKVLETLNLEGNIQEWFEFGGNPYYFKINIDLLNRGISRETGEKLLNLINEYKNERSWLESIRIFLTSQAKYPKISTITQLGKIIMAEPYFESEKTTPEGFIYNSSACHIIHIIGGGSDG